MYCILGRRPILLNEVILCYNIKLEYLRTIVKDIKRASVMLCYIIKPEYLRTIVKDIKRAFYFLLRLVLHTQ